MKKNQGQELSQEELLALQNANGGDGDGQEEGLEEETEAGERDEEMASAEAVAEEEDGEHLDWKEARGVLKSHDERVDYSIDNFEERKVINDLKTRFNAKERTVRLHGAILALGE